MVQRQIPVAIDLSQRPAEGMSRVEEWSRIRSIQCTCAYCGKVQRSLDKRFENLRLALTTDLSQSILQYNWVVLVKSCTSILVVCTFIAVLLMMLPAAGASDGAFDESDAPIFLLSPESSRVKLRRPAVVSTVLPLQGLALKCAKIALRSKERESVPLPDGLQSLLSTFRI